MIVKKSGGHIYGAELTAAEKKAMDMEIKRELAEFDKAHSLEIEAMVLLRLREVFDFTDEQLREFFDGLISDFNELRERYELDIDDGLWLCTKRLKDHGIDIEKWDRERKA